MADIDHPTKNDPDFELTRMFDNGGTRDAKSGRTSYLRQNGAPSTEHVQGSDVHHCD